MLCYILGFETIQKAHNFMAYVSKKVTPIQEFKRAPTDISPRAADLLKRDLVLFKRRRNGESTHGDTPKSTPKASIDHIRLFANLLARRVRMRPVVQ